MVVNTNRVKVVVFLMQDCSDRIQINACICISRFESQSLVVLLSSKCVSHMRPHQALRSEILQNIKL